MRTTVTRSPETFEQVVNEAIVRGLTAERTPPQFRTKTCSMGRSMVELDKANQVAAALDDEEFLRKAAPNR